MWKKIEFKLHYILSKIGVPVAYVYIFAASSGLFFLWQTGSNNKYILSFLLVFSIVIILYARFIEPRWLNVYRIKIPVSEAVLNKPITVALIADLHASHYKKSDWIRRIVKEVLANKPDLILIAGDLINNHFPVDTEVDYLDPLRELTHLPIYYVLGNHDYGTARPQVYFFDDRSEEVVNKMKALGIPLLKNNLVEIVIAGEKITIFGCDDLWSRPIDYSALDTGDTKTPLLFVTHNPDTVMAWPTHIPKPLFTFSGHSHGGQFALFGFPLGSATMQLGRKYYRGVHSYHGLSFYVSPGLGESTIPFRFGVRPELSFITLTPKTAD